MNYLSFNATQQVVRLCISRFPFVALAISALENMPTIGTFQMHQYPGRHFYLHEHPAAVWQTIADALLAAGETVLGFIDKDAALHGQELCGRPVPGHDEVLAQPPPDQIPLAHGPGGTGGRSLWRENPRGLGGPGLGANNGKNQWKVFDMAALRIALATRTIGALWGMKATVVSMPSWSQSWATSPWCWWASAL